MLSCNIYIYIYLTTESGAATARAAGDWEGYRWAPHHTTPHYTTGHLTSPHSAWADTTTDCKPAQSGPGSGGRRTH